MVSDNPEFVGYWPVYYLQRSSCPVRPVLLKGLLIAGHRLVNLVYVLSSLAAWKKELCAGTEPRQQEV